MPSSLSTRPSDVPHDVNQATVTSKQDPSLAIFVIQQPEVTSDVERRTGLGEKDEASVSPADGGKDAWLFLAGCFMLEALVWGFPFSFGVFQSYYTTHAPFDEHAAEIAIIGTCSTGVMYFFAPISLYTLEAWPSVRRLSSILGLLIVVTALVASSFSTAAWHLILTQGILYAIGGSLLYSPTMFYLDEWFIEKKGLAFGIMWSGVGTSGLIFPFLLSSLLSSHGSATTLRIYAIIIFALSSPLIYFVKPRLPPPAPSAQPRTKPKICYAFLQRRTFWFLQAANITEGLGFFIPGIYLPSYASSLHLSPISSTVVLAMLNSSSVLGAIGMGHLCDRLHVTTVILISTLGTTMSIFLLWGFSTHLPLLLLFAATYGIFAGGFSAIWTGMMRHVQTESPSAKMGILMGLFSAGRGIGAVCSGPISEVLMRSHLGGGAAKGNTSLRPYGTSYTPLIIFTGVSALCGVVCLGARRRVVMVSPES